MHGRHREATGEPNTMNRMRAIRWDVRVGITVAAILAPPLAARGQPAVDDVPVFSVRARVTATGGGKPQGKTFSFRWSGIPSDKSEAIGDGWSGRITFARPQVEATLKGYPAMYMKRYPLVVRLQVSPVVDPTSIEAELEFAGAGGAGGGGC